MAAPLQETLNNLSLLLVMTSEGDVQGVELLLGVCDDARKAAEAAKQTRLVQAIDFLTRYDRATVYPKIQQFVVAATQILEGNVEAVLPNEEGTTQASNDPDVLPSVDQSLLVEFIETHTLLLDEFELSLVDYRQQQKDEEELSTSVKRYLHNVKGDAGSIGLVGIEHVCHALEDKLVTQSAADMLDELLNFKEWAMLCLQAYSRGEPTPASAADFIAEISKKPVKRVQKPKEAPAVLSATYTLTGETDILLEFAAEAEEHLNNVESVILEADGSYSKDAIDTIFRGVHSLKGGSAYFQLEEMMQCSHILENFLSQVRDGARVLDPELNRLLLTYIDLQKDTLLRAKQALHHGGVMTRAAASVEFLGALDRYGKGTEAAASPAVAKTSQAPTSESDGTGQRAGKLSIKEFVKVDTNRLDHLIESIGEMVIYSSMLIRDCRELLGTNEGVMNTAHRVEKISRDLQDIGMSMRLVPIKGLFQKMSRLVLDTSGKLGKSIQFTMQGEDTELDRNLIDKLADPLMHMVRNSLDHGIEGGEEREQKGKSRTGNVTLSAYHAGGNIHIQIRDDGRGLNPEKILAKAVEKGIVPAGQKLPESEIFQLIFAPGFSTAAVVTDISGRGVGMDVVRRNVESLRGRIHIQFEVDKGSTFTIELPLTLAIIEGIEIRVGTEFFIVPSLSIVEVVRPKREMITNALDSGETFHFRGKYLPVFRISSLYGIPAEFSEACESTIIVVENGHELVALMVDEVLGQCSTVIKSLGPAFEDGKGLAGCAIMASGDVALILDIRFLVQLARSVYRPIGASSITVQ
ncbi:MAG: chemotaxis protein CheA [Bdellovibrionota bacterium]